MPSKVFVLSLIVALFAVFALTTALTIPGLDAVISTNELEQQQLDQAQMYDKIAESIDYSSKEYLSTTIFADQLESGQLGSIRLSAAGFAHVRNNIFGGRLTQTQVDNINVIMASCNKNGIGDIRHAAYLMATTKWETGSFSPVRECPSCSDAYRRQHFRYYPYYGRGFVQLTWQSNYQKAGNILGLGNQLVNNPDLALRTDISASVLVIGCRDGWFTGVRLSTYINSKGTDYYNARRIVNGLDRAETIAGYARIFEAAFRK